MKLSVQRMRILVTESTTLEVNLNIDVKALDAGSVITENSRTKSGKHDTSSSSKTYITHAVDAYIRPVNDQVPFAERDILHAKGSIRYGTRNNSINRCTKEYTQKPGRQALL
ncbi:hypothetical protein Tco_0568899 [Tanacetum coccineum]